MENNVENQLWTIFENVNRWLEYAEKKNALVITIIGAEVALCKLFENKLNFNCYLIIYFLFLLFCFVIALFSFSPKTKIISWFADIFSKQGKVDNLLLFSQIANYSSHSYIDKLQEKYNWAIRDSKYLEDICNQIVENSKICAFKFTLFKINFWILFVAQLILGFSFLYHIFL